jgi:hypothetical protein
MNENPVYGYQPETMIMFHHQVKTCLAARRYSYVYDEVKAIMNGRTDEVVELALTNLWR